MKAMMGEEDGSVIGYMCAVDFECELGAASGGNTVHPSVEDLKKGHECWESCGIVEVRVTYSKTIHTGYLDDASEAEQ